MDFIFIAKIISGINGSISLLKELWKLVTFSRSKLKKQADYLPEISDSVAARFIQLFEAHGVHRNQIPEFFGHDLTIADVQSEEALVEKLTPVILSDAAKLFSINSEWLPLGHGDVYPKYHFYKQPEKFGKFITQLPSNYDVHHFECSIFRSNKRTTSGYDALMIVKTPIGELGNRFIYAYHLCPGWMTHYWISAADLACCISSSAQKGVYPHGCIVEDSWLAEFMNCQRLPSYDFESEILAYPYKGQWNPGEFSDTAQEFIKPLEINQDNFSIPSALDRWWRYYDRGLIYVYSDDVNARVGEEFQAMAEVYGLELQLESLANSS
ncbi:hypothetical protein [Neptuniibacter sp. QD34_54]|uniref:hypothetical protein n=1 Tax=Neptuniibacter sp. QD34_54 TaxID=3398208 RepID=UPI0039F5E7D9